MAAKNKEAHNAAIDIRAKSQRWGQEEDFSTNISSGMQTTRLRLVRFTTI